jgi:type IV pilus assembly protein PilC
MSNNKTKIKKQVLETLVESKTKEFKHFNWHINFGFNVEKILFARTLATILNSGVNIADALRIVEAQSVGQFKFVVNQIRKDVESGQDLASALTKYPKYFNEVYVGLVNVGEKTGHLAECLNNVAEQQEKELELARKVQSASLYPAIVFICLLGLAALLSYYILPQLIVIFNSFNMPLPWTTKLLLAAARIIRDWGLLILISIIALLIFVYYIVKTKAIRPYWQAVGLSLPFFGELVKKLTLARFCMFLGVLLKSGIPLNEALKIIFESLGNEVYKIQLKKIQARVLAGLSLGESIENLGRVDLFPKIVSQMISVGERTGTLEKNISYLADFYEKEVDNISKNLVSVIEPVLLIIVGFIVALVAVAIISPIYEFISTLSHSI